MYLLFMMLAYYIPVSVPTCGYFVYYLYITCACLWECINFYELLQL